MVSVVEVPGQVMGSERLLDLSSLIAVGIVVRLLMIDLLRVTIRMITILGIRLRCLRLSCGSDV